MKEIYELVNVLGIDYTFESIKATIIVRGSNLQSAKEKLALVLTREFEIVVSPEWKL